MNEEILELIEKDVSSCLDKGQKRTRNEKLIEYYKNPNYCKYCAKIILVPFKGKVKETRVKQFCNHSCFASLNNAKRIRKLKPIKDKKQNKNTTNTSTKKELFNKRINWQSARSTISKEARRKYKQSNKPRQCFVCGYNKHYEICHIKPVSKFLECSLILEINSIDNLIALCPNCHWEYDNELMVINFKK